MSAKNTSKVAEVLGADLATGDQIEHLMDMIRQRLKGRKLTLGEVQYIIQNGGRYLSIMDEAVDVLVGRVRSDVSNTIVHMVRNIRRSRTVEEAVNATGRAKYVNNSVLATMPVGQGSEDVELVYFKLGRYIQAEDLEREYEARGFRPDPQAQMADNEADPSFADDHPNSCFWDRDGQVSSFAAFYRWGDGREVLVGRSDDGRVDRWWFAGVRK